MSTYGYSNYGSNPHAGYGGGFGGGGGWRGNGGRGGRGGTGGRGGRHPGGGIDGRFRDPRAGQATRRGNRQAPLPLPSNEYLAATLLPSTTLPLDKPLPAEHPSPVVVFSLNRSLVFRKMRTAKGSFHPCLRPYLATFLEYLCGCDSARSDSAPANGSDKTRFRPVAYSAMRGANLINLLRTLNLVPDTHLPAPPSSTKYGEMTHDYKPYEPDFELGDVLSAVFSRESMGLDEHDYEADTQTTKNLKKVWEKLELGSSGVDDLSAALGGLNLASTSSRNTDATSLDEAGARISILIDDEEAAAAQFPYSLVQVSTFEPSMPSYTIPESAHPSGVLDLPLSHPLGSDDELLKQIYLLHLLRHQTNIAAALRSGFVERVKSETRHQLEDAEDGAVSEEDVQRALADRGRQVCRLAGIEVSREWKPRWREEMLEKEERE
ncbi:hypothetical protein JCM8097_002923 [Rhodosporidiobolus ruineniae]